MLLVRPSKVASGATRLSTLGFQGVLQRERSRAFLEPRESVEGRDLRPDGVADAPWLDGRRLAWDVNTRT